MSELFFDSQKIDAGHGGGGLRQRVSLTIDRVAAVYAERPPGRLSLAILPNMLSQNFGNLGMLALHREISGSHAKHILQFPIRAFVE